MKKCSRCLAEKEPSEFHKNLSFCKDCNNRRKREYYARNREAALAQKKEYYLLNKEQISECGKNWRRKNKDTVKKRNAEYYLKNKQKLIQDAILYEKNRKQVDPVYRARKNLRKRITDVIKEKSFSPKSRSVLGVGLKDFKQYIESKWQEGMSWENYGYYGWHIDHIKPLSSASNIKELEELCHYTNLQPLWAKDNLLKSNK